jgi:AraC-like DNA-binding protein
MTTSHAQPLATSQDISTETLKQAVIRWTQEHANYDGLAVTPVKGLRMMCLRRPFGPLHSIYKPLVCFVLQGTKQLVIAEQPQQFRAGQSVVVTMDVPVAGRIVEASPERPYIAIAIELDMALIHELASEMEQRPPALKAPSANLFFLDTDEAATDSAMRLMRLLDTPDAIPLLRPAIMRELHYWLLAGQHGPAIRQIALPDGNAERLGSAIRLLRNEYRHPLALERLAAAAGMSVSTFGRRFKAMTSLTPLQFQKHLRLCEARRLMLGEGLSATKAAFAVGYESVAHFTRDYARLFGAPPRRDVRGPAEVTAKP